MESKMQITHQNQTLDLSTLGLPEKVVHAISQSKVLSYLLDNGLKQALGDAKAMSKAEAEKITTLHADGKGPSLEDTLANRVKAKFDNILAGTVSIGSRGPRLQGLDHFLFQEASAQLQRATLAAGKTWPTGKGASEAIRVAVEKYWATPKKTHEVVKARAQAMFKAQSEPVQVDESDLA
jgi:hypothetical protein